MLAFGEEVSGYDIKKWADWSIRHYYWSPSFSQVYSELKRLEKHGYATSRMQSSEGARTRRMYRITPTGLSAMRAWETEAPVDPPILKHGVILRVAFGHLSSPERLRAMLSEHVARMDTLERRVRIDATAAEAEPGWAYSRLAMRWAERYYAAERGLAQQLMDELDDAQATITAAEPSHGGYPTPRPGHWREVEEQVAADREE